MTPLEVRERPANQRIEVWHADGLAKDTGSTRLVRRQTQVLPPQWQAMPVPPTAQPPLLASIDIGSNSFRLELARVMQGRYQRVMYLKETVRLGGGLDDAGSLNEASCRRGLECLRRFATHLHGIEPEHIRAVATQTLREAKNRDAFLERAQRALQQPIEIISGREEARLTYTGVAHLQPGHRSRLVIDIGGRSTEMILGTGLVPRVAESFAVGSVGLSLRYFADGKLTAGAFRAAQIAAGAELEEAITVFAPSHWHEALGSSGTVSAVSQLLIAAGISHGTITPASLRWCIEQCLQAGHINKLQLPGLRDDRRAVVAGGLALLYTLCMQFGIKSLEPSKGALRQGVIIEMHQRLKARQALRGRRTVPRGTRDFRDRTVRELQMRFNADQGQAKRVSEAALALHRQVSALHDAHQELGWACALHEIGQMVSHHDHHRHSAYLLGHADAAGFSQNELRRLSDFVLGQRGGLKKVGALIQQAPSVWQLMSLRLAVILCHARTAAPVAHIKFRVHAQSATLRIPKAWAQSHPRTMHLLEEETLAWRNDTRFRLTIAVG